MQRKVLDIGKPAFSRSLPFSELNAITLLLPFIKATLRYEDCFVVSADEARKEIDGNGERDEWSADKADASEPGSPSALFWNT